MGKNVLESINATAIVRRDANAGSNGLGIDVKMWTREGVPVRKTPLVARFVFKNDHFTKTGSGQT